MMVYKGITDGMVASMFFMLLQKRVIIYSYCAIIYTPTS